MLKILERHGIELSDLTLYRQAFCHGSYYNENPKLFPEDNERLEFLGDSVLYLVTTTIIYEYFPCLDEGKMSKIRSSLVNESYLLELALEWKVDQCILLGSGEEKNRGRQNRNILANCVEAIIGAVYLSGGLSAAHKLLEGYIIRHLHTVDLNDVDDYKTQLHEYAHKHGVKIAYQELSSEIKDHQHFFTFQVLVSGKVLGMGTGFNKKQAQQQASKVAIELLKAQEKNH